MNILGIETSCDETGIAIYNSDKGIVAQSLYSQVELHAEYGGVVPELASRDHVRKTALLINDVLSKANYTSKQIDGIAFTQGPGLIGALLVGATLGRSLAFGWGCPAIGVHHMEGHLLAPMLEDDAPEFPFVALLVSGGHTMLVDVKGVGEYRILGESIDDAAGEAFDKTAKIMGLGYPGGPALSKLAQTGEAGIFRFPRPMTDRPGMDFSFSGLKTFAANKVKEHHQCVQSMANIALAFEEAVVDTLMIKSRRALKETGYHSIVVAGGVSANRRLRLEFDSMMKKVKGRAYYPKPEYCTDNGAMIAYAGYCRLKHNETSPLDITVKPRWPLEELSPP